ncbi:NAD(P)H-binding protein [Umezawaea endophytica]|uniref:NAD(P)H-binding protein n=1 Tax=Umezawaea endophytica TaxID=1654476 RepID=A0A9X3A4Q3_9PSEU|nr:NAD(P)H-binding protein [Umezawaea endophytica]MCS7483029.1 NAD(P)H-binding protein [Umezawaea endophytica]
MDGRILVIGARGGVGRHVVEQLVAAGRRVRGSVRKLAAGDSADVVVADLTKPDTLRGALDGVSAVFLYAPTEGAAGFVGAAKAAGVEHVVLLSSGSVLLPAAVGNLIAEEHRAVERELAESGLRWTPIRPLVLANNALNWAGSVRDERVVRLVHADAVTAPVHERDIAAVAVAALLGGGEHVSELLTGPELLSQERQVELIGEAVGADVRIEELPPDQARARFGGSAAFDAVLEFIAAARAGGSPATATAERVLGRPPASFAEWVDDHVDEFR